MIVISNTGLWETQKSVVSAISSSTTLSTLISGKIYDEPPTDTDYPYIVIGELTEIPNNNIYELGFEDTITIFIHTRPYGLGWYPAYNILDEMNRVLNYKRLSFDSLFCCICKLDNIIQEKYQDKRILHVRYRLILENLSNHTVT